jgi:hypothetical protein
MGPLRDNVCIIVAIDGLEHHASAERADGSTGGLRSWHSLLLLRDAKAPNLGNNKAFRSLDYYFEWPKVADAVIKAHF